MGVIILKKEEFMQQIGYRLPEIFDQHLLDNASEMFSKWGMTTHMDEKEYLFERSGLAPKTGYSKTQQWSSRISIISKIRDLSRSMYRFAPLIYRIIFTTRRECCSFDSTL